MWITRSAKIISLFVLGVLSILGIASFAADPSFSLSISSWTQLKLHCNYIMGVIINPGAVSYNWFDSTVKFDSGFATITHISINPFFTSSTNGYIKSGFLYRAYGVRPAWSGNSVLQAATFWFKTIQNTLSTMLEFTTLTGWTIIFDKNTTDDGAVINSSISSLDTLTGITDATYTFVPLSCIVDSNAPGMSNTDPSNGDRYVDTGHVVSFILYDWAGPWTAVWPAPLGTNNRSHYRYSWLNAILTNYQPAPSTVDNQEWVNSGSIVVNISCPTCSWSWAYTFTAANLNITTWLWNSSINRYTRDSKDRWYAVNFPAPAPYEIEKLVTVNVQWVDNPNENGNIHTGNYSFSFNAPSLPTIARIAPSLSTNINPKIDPIIFHFEDDWAGVNPDTISLTIPEILSGSTVIYTGYTYSWSDFTIILINGSAGTGNSGWYEVSFTPKREFPSNTTITLTWSVYDYAANHWIYAGSFTTRMSCADRWCADIFQLNILWWTNIWNYLFTWSLIIVTWTNLSSPYPYLTWTNNDILMCGRPYTWTILTWNIWIYDKSGTQINGSMFTGNEIYITGMDGLDFIFSGDKIIIQ